MNDENVEKGLVMLAVEKALLVLKEDSLDEVSKKLKNNFNCSLLDCYKNPEYLKVSQVLDGNQPYYIIDKNAVTDARFVITSQGIVLRKWG